MGVALVSSFARVRSLCGCRSPHGEKAVIMIGQACEVGLRPELTVARSDAGLWSLRVWDAPEYHGPWNYCRDEIKLSKWALLTCT